MAKIVKITREETEIDFDKLVELVKKNWDIVSSCLILNTELGPGTFAVMVSGHVNTENIRELLCKRVEGLCIDAMETSKLGAAIIQVLRDIQSQNSCLQKMEIKFLTPPEALYEIYVSFEVMLLPAVLAYVEPINIPGPDNPTDPDPTRRAEMIALSGRNQNNASPSHRGETILDDADPPVPF